MSHNLATLLTWIFIIGLPIGFYKIFKEQLIRIDDWIQGKIDCILGYLIETYHWNKNAILGSWLGMAIIISDVATIYEYMTGSASKFWVWFSIIITLLIGGFGYNLWRNSVFHIAQDLFRFPYRVLWLKFCVCVLALLVVFQLNVRSCTAILFIFMFLIYLYIIKSEPRPPKRKEAKKATIDWAKMFGPKQRVSPQVGKA